MIKLRLLALLLLTNTALSLGNVYADEIEASATDCTILEVTNIEEPLTKEEMILKMENELFDSIEKYSSCMEKVHVIAVEETGSAESENNQSNAKDSAEDASQSSGEKGVESATTQEDDSGTALTKNVGAASGAENKLVKPKDNDSIICKFIYEEINNEKDPKSKADLVVEYNKYNCG